MNIKQTYTELIGNTPLFELNKIKKLENLEARVVVKLESFNPAGSIKDRVAANMILTAEKEGKLKKGSVIIEPTSGNTGIGLSSVGRARGYRVILTMPDSMSVERRQLMEAYGAEIVLTPGANGMKGAIEKARELADKTENSFLAGQFVNRANPEVHIETTGPEIWNDTDGKIDILVVGVGTGGSVTGLGQYLKNKNKNIEIVALEPETSAVLSGEAAGKHGIQGIGAGFVPEILDTSIYDKIIRITDDEAKESLRLLAKEEGILAGISSGAAVHAAIALAKKSENKGKMIVAILPDTGEHYLSMNLLKNI